MHLNTWDKIGKNEMTIIFFVALYYNMSSCNKRSHIPLLGESFLKAVVEESSYENLPNKSAGITWRGRAFRMFFATAHHFMSLNAKNMGNDTNCNWVHDKFWPVVE